MSAQQRARRQDARWRRRWAKALQERTILGFCRRAGDVPYVWGGTIAENGAWSYVAVSTPTGIRVVRTERFAG